MAGRDTGRVGRISALRTRGAVEATMRKALSLKTPA
jgi:hypothetical protein